MAYCGSLADADAAAEAGADLIGTTLAGYTGMPTSSKTTLMQSLQPSTKPGPNRPSSNAAVT